MKNWFPLFWIIISVLITSCIKQNDKALIDDELSYSADIYNNTIYYIANTATESSIVSVKPDGTEKKIILSNDGSNRYTLLSISHDATHLVISTINSVYVVDINSGEKTDITNTSLFSTQQFNASQISWSTKSNYILVVDTVEDKMHYLTSGYEPIEESTIKNPFQLMNDSEIISAVLSPKKNEIAIVIKKDGEFQLFTTGLEGWGNINTVSHHYSSNNEIANVIFSKNATKLYFTESNNLKSLQLGYNATTELEWDNKIMGINPSSDNAHLIFSSRTQSSFDVFTLNLSSKDTSAFISLPTVNEISPFWN